jgi:hypothetical protein
MGEVALKDNQTYGGNGEAEVFNASLLLIAHSFDKVRYKSIERV